MNEKTMKDKSMKQWEARAVAGAAGLMILVTCVSLVQGAEYQYQIHETSEANYLLLVSGSKKINWTRTPKTGSADRHDLMLYDGTATTPVTDVTITKVAEFEIQWDGYLDGIPSAGPLLLYEGDSSGWVYVAFFDENEEVVAGFELLATGLEYIGIEVGSTATGPNCVCWPPQGATCTNSECNDSEPCGTGGACMWRWTVAAAIQDQEL